MRTWLIPLIAGAAVLAAAAPGAAQTGNDMPTNTEVPMNSDTQNAAGNATLQAPGRLGNEPSATELLNEVSAQGFSQFRSFERTADGYRIVAFHPAHGWVTLDVNASSGDIRIVQ